MPVSRAILTLIIPTIIGQMVTVIYNMADTFFIGQINNPDQIAASTLAMPIFVMMLGIANLFGIGGASLISRSLGVGDRERAKRTATFSIFGAVFAAAVYGICAFLFREPLLDWLGTDSATYDYCFDYVFWTVTVGAIPTILSACLAHLVRAEGYAKEASIGVAIGGVANIILDPIFIFAFGLEIKGAAIATMISNAISMVYFIVLVLKNRKSTCIVADPALLTLRYGIPKEVLLVGFPSFLMLLMGTASNLILNKLVVSYSNVALAGLGIAKKLDMLAFAIANGMTQGVMPLIGYNYASGDRERMSEVIKKSFIYAVGAATVGAVFLLLCAVPISALFIDDGETVEYAQYFLRTLAITCPAISATMMSISALQATGEKNKPLFLSIIRKGGLDIPIVFILDAMWGLMAIAWATPLSDLLAMLISLAIFIPHMRSLKGLGAPAQKRDD